MKLYSQTGLYRVNKSNENIDLNNEKSQNADYYFQRLAKLVPTEVLALYLSFKEIANTWLGIWALICLALVIFVRTLGTMQSGKHVQVPSVLVASISFMLWVYATGGHILGLELPKQIPGIISVSVGVWTFVVPYLYKGD
jgi:hypothetical protein